MTSFASRMRVLQFGFAGDSGSEKHLPHRFLPHCVVYTGTHDNDHQGLVYLHRCRDHPVVG